MPARLGVGDEPLSDLVLRCPEGYAEAPAVEDGDKAEGQPEPYRIQLRPEAIRHRGLSSCRRRGHSFDDAHRHRHVIVQPT